MARRLVSALFLRVQSRRGVSRQTEHALFQEVESVQAIAEETYVGTHTYRITAAASEPRSILLCPGRSSQFAVRMPSQNGPYAA